jgi:hypothetical protein
LSFNQLPLNAPSRLSILDDKNPSMMQIHFNGSYIGDFNVLVTDYGESRHMVLQDEVFHFIAIFRQLCGIFHLQERVEPKVFKSGGDNVEDKKSHQRSA